MPGLEETIQTTSHSRKICNDRREIPTLVFAPPGSACRELIPEAITEDRPNDLV
jgi:hypothetical protein